jgi:hypothetical protein
MDEARFTNARTSGNIGGPIRAHPSCSARHCRRRAEEEDPRTMDTAVPKTIDRPIIRHLACSCVLGLCFGAAACSMTDDEGSGAKSASAEMQPDTFKFAPPDGTHGIRTEHRRYEVALIGTPLRDLEEEELRWNIDAKHTGDGFTVNQELAHVMLKHNGETVVDRDVDPGAIAAQLVIDKAGNLVDVRGLDDAPKALKALVPSENGPAAERMFSKQNLRALVATRYEETLGDVVGRPTKTGSSWTTEGRPGSAIVSKTITVQQTEPCGTQMCAHLQASYKLDPRTMINLASEVVHDYGRWAGQGASKLNVQAAMYSMEGSLITEPATMINHEASLDESGKVLFAAPKHQMEIDLTGKTDISFEYAKPVSATDPAPSKPAVATQP